MPRQRGLRGLPGPGADEERPALRRTAEALHAASDTGGHDQRHRPDSRVVKGLRGFIQGYNAQAVTNEQQVVLAADVMVASPDFGHLEPMLCAAERELAVAGVSDTPQVVLADAATGTTSRWSASSIAGSLS